jgi:hypothetical protein
MAESVQGRTPSRPYPTEMESPIISIFRFGAVVGIRMPSVSTPVMRKVPRELSDRLRNSTVCVPFGRAGVEIEVPFTFPMRIGSPPSIIRSTLEVPVTVLIPIVAFVPSNVKDTPVLGHVSSLVAGLTLPTKL